MIRSRNPAHQMVGPEINFGGTGYTFSSASDAYEFEIHFVQPFTMKYVFIPYSANVENFKVEASHAGMLAVLTSKPTNDGLVVDGFPSILISMLVVTITHTTDGYLPSHITLNIVSKVIFIILKYNFRCSSRVSVILYIRRRT